MNPGSDGTQGGILPGSAYGLLVAATVLAAVLGYAGYALYPRFDLPAVSSDPEEPEGRR